MINLETLTASAVELIFNSVPTAVGLGTYHRNVTGRNPSDYDPVSDTPAPPIASIPNVRMLKVSASSEELAGTEVSIDDVKVLIPAKDLPGFKPANKDYFFLQGVMYDVIKIKVIPVETLRIIYARAK